MDKLEEELAPHAEGVDIAFAAFGVGKGSAKMANEEVRKIEITYPTAFASAAKAGGARVLAMMTAVGADSQSSTKYLRNIGDKEKKSEELTFDFLGLYRPAVILGNSNTPSALGLVMPLFDWAMPSRYHSIHKNDLARAMVAQSEQAFLALAQGKGPGSSGGEDSRVQGDEGVRDGRQRRSVAGGCGRQGIRVRASCRHHFATHCKRSQRTAAHSSRIQELVWLLRRHVCRSRVCAARLREADAEDAEHDFFLQLAQDRLRALVNRRRTDAGKK